MLQKPTSVRRSWLRWRDEASCPRLTLVILAVVACLWLRADTRSICLNNASAYDTNCRANVSAIEEQAFTTDQEQYDMCADPAQNQSWIACNNAAQAACGTDQNCLKTKLQPVRRKHWPHASKHRTLMTPLPSIPITKTRLVAIKLRSKGNRSALPQGCVTMTQTARIRTPETRAPMGNACPAGVTARRGKNAVRTGAVTPLLPLAPLAPSCWIRSMRDSI
jgi:hypothetical protein